MWNPEGKVTVHAVVQRVPGVPSLHVKMCCEVSSTNKEAAAKMYSRWNDSFKSLHWWGNRTICCSNGRPKAFTQSGSPCGFPCQVSLIQTTEGFLSWTWKRVSISRSKQVEEGSLNAFISSFRSNSCLSANSVRLLTWPGFPSILRSPILFFLISIVERNRWRIKKILTINSTAYYVSLLWTFKLHTAV